MSESPITYNVWSAISAVSAVLKDNVFIRRGNYKIYPNQYIVLVGPPGVGKGEAIRPAHSFVKNPITNIPFANYIQDSVTMPKLIDIIATGFKSPPTVSNGMLLNRQDSTCILQAEELATLISSSEQMPVFLCRTWDGKEYVYDTKGKGKSVIKDMCVSLIGACTQKFIRSINNNHGAEVNNGFTARTIFVFAEMPSQAIVWPPGFEDYPQIKYTLDNDLQIISNLRGEFGWLDSARKIYEGKYQEIGSSISDDDSDIVRHFKARQRIHILKVAMTLSAASRDDLVIDDYTICESITLVDEVLKTLDSAFGGVGESELAESMHKITEYISKKGISSRNEILKDNRRNITAEDLDRVLYVLEVSRIVYKFYQGKQLLYKYVGVKP